MKIKNKDTGVARNGVEKLGGHRYWGFKDSKAKADGTLSYYDRDQWEVVPEYIQIEINREDWEKLQVPEHTIELYISSPIVPRMIPIRWKGNPCEQ